MIRNLSAWHIIVLVLVVLLLFGANRLPGLAKSVGQSMKIFKTEVKDLRDDDKRPDEPTEGTTPPKV
ncbi:Sec-independent protein translocase subunit TatA [Cellulomonas septica]|uniref:Sec-independent protein translocase protein TatA n=1 Tax=Cellulomonas septica TaxID=285080 RepID=A0ABX1K1W5_9CELL|nr:Sec-independent protein translocase subunit TatA [Cellulomonas septica]